MAQPKSQRRNRQLGTTSEMSQYIDAGANKIKKRIRDIERLLKKKRDILPDTVIVEKERTLDALKLELENAQMKHVVIKNAKKYHMIRFFETKKALRKYKNVLKNLDKDDNASQKQLLEAKVNLCYVVNFPKTEKYIALFPSENKDDENESESDEEDKNTSDKLDKTQLRKEAYLKLIKKKLKNGTLPVSFDNILKGQKLPKDHVGVSLDEEHKRQTESSSAKDSLLESENQQDNDEEDEFFE
ncbi:hypothetical protein TBLA_0C06890 [Henningerozyma blattae CBS 6284]|uniref:rRNA-processing protein EFG1 n=1 Tax=Henningerozyma blattae (strain ATCC 34711 / CBS 6284 / DSM 70876 / NBRC 10599 / NRRL Y-10934 / UCD 77-7) TaxID=1071380 RepID=I2H279_HENB6|nr:hypothetical protein TBLA_0C06890 [Tetrapisispora blattae CBS 6284]CCH60481.1 hypothetical protein TBLA_0C06890 [Tetrapisispora blattae CBS 6284]